MPARLFAATASDARPPPHWRSALELYPDVKYDCDNSGWWNLEAEDCGVCSAGLLAYAVGLDLAGQLNFEPPAPLAVAVPDEARHYGWAVSRATIGTKSWAQAIAKLREAGL